MAKTKDELQTLRSEYQGFAQKMSELTLDEMKEVTAGIIIPDLPQDVVLEFIKEWGEGEHGEMSLEKLREAFPKLFD